MNKYQNSTTRHKIWPSSSITFLIPIILFVSNTGIIIADTSVKTVTYTIVDTDQARCYNNNTAIEAPKAGAAFFGQDAQYKGNQPAYKDNGDGTVTDLNTGLMWQSDPSRFPFGGGPQGDVIRIYNFVRCVRGGI
jgi:hypothetical protein